MDAHFPPLGHAALIERLAAIPPAGITVVTVNARLARTVIGEVDRAQVAAGRASWEAPDALPWGAFLARCHEEALYDPAGTSGPGLLKPAQAQLLWEEAVHAGPWRERVPAAGAMAALAARAWDLAHAWRLEGAVEGEGGSDDARAFASWCAHYRRRTRRDNLVDAARLPALLAERYANGSARPPEILVAYGFELLTPQQEDFLAACERAGTRVERCGAPRVAAQVRRAVFDSPRQELEHAARWARQRLEAHAAGPAPRIAVVVPRLDERRAEVARVFARTLAPAGGAEPLFNLSLGASLASFPLVDAALAVIELAAAPLAYERVSALLRSPFIAGGESEMAGRARLDAALRTLAPATLSANRLRTLLPEAVARRGAAACPKLDALLGRLIAASADDGRAPAHDWARRYTVLLEAVGFPGDRTLDSTEFQTLAKWREALGEFATLGSVAPAWTAGEARTRLARLCADVVFQPASGDAPVQVLGILESAGLAFDHLWVSGLTEEEWPLPARPHPLIAPELQRRAGIPEASAERSLALDISLTDSWRGAAPEVMLSSARADGDRELLPSPLVAEIAETPRASLAIADYPSLAQAQLAAADRAGARGTRADTPAPALAAATAPGGTAVLADQAACPFRAYAHYRLEAHALESPDAGLTAAERGTLLHALMAHLWGALRDQATLIATDPAHLAALVDEAAAHAVARLRADRPGRLEGRFAALERERLARIAKEWLEIERARAPFEVAQRESRVALAAGSLHLTGRIDRVDRLQDGGVAVIDYKSGRVNPGVWLGPRPDDAQLPLYALATGETEDVRAVAFARLKVGELGFTGLVRDDGLLAGARTVTEHRTASRHAASWDELVAQWRREIDALGDEFVRGEARVDPKRGLATCRNCDLQALCRVHERLGGIADEEAGEDDAAPDEEAP
jgi:probable DNA repair protein